MLPELDLATIFIANAIICGVGAVMLGTIRRGNPDLAGVGSWALGRTCLAVSFAYLHFSMAGQFRLLALPGFLCLVTGLCLDYAGFHRFLGQRWRNGLPIILVSAGLAAALVIAALLGVRRGYMQALSLSAQIVPSLACAFLLLRAGHGASRQAMRTTGWLYLSWAILCVARLGNLAFHDFDMVEIAWTTAPAVTLATVILTCHGLGLVWMIVGRLQEVLVQQAATDPLTGALNRRALQTRLEAERARVARDGGGFALATVDLDHFKQLNDTHGHAVGDATLVAVVDLATRMLRPGDIVARLGGEEFCLVLPGADGDEAMRRVEALRQALGRLEIVSPAGPVTVAASFGMAIHGQDGHDWPALLKAADGALYRAKSLGRNRVERAGTAA